MIGLDSQPLRPPGQQHPGVNSHVRNIDHLVLVERVVADPAAGR